MNYPRKDGATRRAHLEAAARQGVAQARAELAAPPVSELAAGVLDLYYDVVGIRGGTGFGPAPLQARQILDYQELRGVRLAQWQIDAILHAERGYLAKYDELSAPNAH